MASTVLISIFCADRTGLVAAIAGRLFDLGANLGDTSFAVLGSGAEFTTVCDFATETAPETVADELKALAELAGGKVEVTPFGYSPVHGPTARITHRIAVGGGDSPGLVARLSEVFVDFGANIVRLTSERVPGEGNDGSYRIRLEVWIPPERASACLNTVANTAGELKLSCDVETL